MPSCFGKLLEVIFACFAKIKWMPSCFAKLLELLLAQRHPERVPNQLRRSASDITATNMAMCNFL
jgi:hypothetical protein